MLSAIAFLACQIAQPGQEPGNPPPAEAALPAPAEDSWDLELLPSRNIYPSYLADPRQSRTSSKVERCFHSDSNHIKIESTLGSTRPLALWKNPRDPDEEAELFIEAAVFSRFDISEQWDMDAADYRFGFPFAYRYGDVTMKFHVWHLTSHLGDEYLSREQNRTRDSYHNDELALALSWQVTPALRAYGELGYSFYAGTDTEKGRAQVGAEWVGEAWTGKVTPYAAADASTRKEIDWHVNLTLQTGVMLRSKPEGSGFRVTMEYYRGRDQQTQFKSSREQYVAWGVAADF